jgi:hypothetical protein
MSQNPVGSREPSVGDASRCRKNRGRRLEVGGWKKKNAGKMPALRKTSLLFDIE